jgi:hypothetical protein
MTDAEIQVEITKQIRDKLAAGYQTSRDGATQRPPDKENAESNCQRDRQTRLMLVRPGYYWNKLSKQCGGSSPGNENAQIDEEQLMLIPPTRHTGMVSSRPAWSCTETL